MMTELSVTAPLTEQVTDWIADEFRVDPLGRTVYGVALVGLKSRNGYEYRREALAGAIDLYDQKPVFLDHASTNGPPRERTTRDLVGSLQNPRFVDGRIRADVLVVDTPSGQTFLSLAAANQPAVGMSHVVLARKSADGQFVESIHEVLSVDVVLNPATTQSFSEQAARSKKVMPFEEASPRSYAALATEVAELSMAVERLQQEEVWKASLARHQLDPALVPDVVREAWFASKSPDARDAMLREQLRLYERLARRLPHSQLRVGMGDVVTAGNTKLTDTAFVNAVKGRRA